MTVTTVLDVDAVRAAVATVDDPEFPGVSFVDLGLLEAVEVDGGRVRIELIPTFSGCPALEVIRRDVEDAVAVLDGVTAVDVSFAAAPVWTPDRISPAARSRLASSFTVAVDIGGRAVTCPRCGSPTSHVSDFGPTRCRAVRRCDGCGEIVEVVR